MLDVFYYRAKFDGARISPDTKNVEFFYLFVCLSVRHAFERQSLCARFRQGATETILMPLDRGRFVGRG